MTIEHTRSDSATLEHKRWVSYVRRQQMRQLKDTEVADTT